MGEFNQIVESSYGRMICNKNDYISQVISRYGEWEPDAILIWKKFLQPGMTVLDVGANIGAHTLALSRLVGENGKVLAFEPQRFIFYMLAGVAAINSLTNVWCYQKAVSNKEGSIFVTDLDMEQNYNFGGFSLSEPLYGQPRSLGGEHVSVITIDSLDLKECHFIKVDVEGMEENVLRGAQKTISKYCPIIYVENNRPNKSESLTKFIRNQDYKIYVDKQDVENNLLCVPVGSSMEMDPLEEV